MRKATYLLVGVLLAFAPAVVFAGGQQEGTAGADAVTPITWSMAVDDASGSTWFMEKVEEEFNVDIIPNGVHHNNEQEVSIMIASGEIPDCGPIPGARDLLDQGLIRTFTRQDIETNMPGYTKMINTLYPIGWEMLLVPGEEDVYYTIHGVSAASDVPLFTVGFRSDWARKVGIDLPDYDEKKIPLDMYGRVHFYDQDFSLQWLEEALIKFRDGDPDGNGKNDTIPWGAYYHGGFRWAWAPLVGAYGLSFRDNFMVGNDLVMWSIHPKYKEFLKEMADWYDKDLIDKEFVTLDRQKGYEKIYKGLVAAASSSFSYSGRTFAMNRPPNAFVPEEDLGTGAEVVMIPPPVGPFGDQGSVNYRPATPLGYQDFVINAKVDDDKMALILQINDWMNYNEDRVWIQRYFGKPNVHFDWAGEPWNSTAVKRDQGDVPEGELKIGEWPTVYPPAYTPSRQKFLLSTQYGTFLEEWLLGDWGKELAIRSYRWDLFSETDLDDVYEEFGATLGTMQEEFFYGAVMGEVDVDSEWDAYVRKWRNSGGNELLAEYEKAPILSELLKGNIVY